MNQHETKLKVLWMITEKGDKSYWTRVGVGFENRDGSINLTLDAVPVGNHKLQLRDYQPRDADDEGTPREDKRHDGGRERGNGRGARQASRDEVPL